MSLELLGAVTIPSVSSRPGLVDAPSLDDVRANKATISPGMRGDPVSYVQRALKLYGVAETGVFESSTEAAVRQFQGDYGLRVDGQVGQKTLVTIDNPSAIEHDKRPAYGDNMVEAFHANRALAPKVAPPADAPRPPQPGSAYAVPLLAGGVGLALVALLVAIFTGRRR